MQADGASPHYGTWIRKRAIVVFGVLAALSVLASGAALATPWALLFLLPAAVFGWIFLVIGLASHRFSDRGGGYQARIHALIRSHSRGNRVLDIGCGNGALAIQLAKESPAREVTGLDYWGAAWEYSQAQCERNAAIEGVADRVRFVAGSAASLPVADGEFDCVVSCLTFHEVRDLPDKTAALSEALRVVRPGGTFAFIDLFADRGAYPQPSRIADRIAAAGGMTRVDAPLSSLLPLPFPLNGKRLLGHARLIAGEKAGPSN